MLKYCDSVTVARRSFVCESWQGLISTRDNHNKRLAEAREGEGGLRRRVDCNTGGLNFNRLPWTTLFPLPSSPPLAVGLDPGRR